MQRICSRATVLRHGRVTGACDPRQETTGSLARMMVGSDVASVQHEGLGKPGDIQLEIAGLSVPARTPFAMSLKDVSLRVRAGEILAIAGVAGNGQGSCSTSFPVNIPWPPTI